jgi:hypothetical protein
VASASFDWLIYTGLEIGTDLDAPRKDTMAPNSTDYKYLDMTGDELMLLIGDSLLEGGFGAKPLPDVEKRQIAANWFASNLSEFRAKICGNASFRAQVGPAAGNRNTLFALLFDTFTSAHLGVPAGAIAAQILSYGLGNLCPEWK